MLLSHAKTDFLEYLEVEQNRSQKTIANYDHYLVRLLDFAGEIELDDITIDLVRKWRIWLARMPGKHSVEMQKSSVNIHLIALRTFLVFCAKRDLHTLAPEKIELARTPRPRVTFVTTEEVAHMCSMPDTTILTGLRDRAIIELLFSAGLRVSELVSLDRAQLNLAQGEFTVRGKGQKDRLAFISPDAVQWLTRYLEQRLDKSPALFISISATRDATIDPPRLSIRTIQRLIAKYAIKAGITKHVSPHTIRHGFATDLLMNGSDIRSVQTMLGHSSIMTTQIYTHVTDAHLKEIHRRNHGTTKQD